MSTIGNFPAFSKNRVISIPRRHSIAKIIKKFANKKKSFFLCDIEKR